MGAIARKRLVVVLRQTNPQIILPRLFWALLPMRSGLAHLRLQGKSQLADSAALPGEGVRREHCALASRQP
jgi:hypothetical protein